MSKEEEFVRQCKDCPDWMHTVCCFAFGKFWRDKSHNGAGCAHPVDGVAESWRITGWKPGGKPNLTTGVVKKRDTNVVQMRIFASHRLKQADPLLLTDDDY